MLFVSLSHLAHHESGGIAGEWFCPRCRSELELDSTDQPIHASMVPTRLMKQEDCYRSLAAALGGFQPCLTSHLLFFGTYCTGDCSHTGECNHTSDFCDHWTPGYQDWYWQDTYQVLMAIGLLMVGLCSDCTSVLFDPLACQRSQVFSMHLVC